MNCFSCSLMFSQHRVPRVLIDCGHTICEPCLVSNHINNSVRCNQCHQLNYGAIQHFPKNLTLLNLQQSSNGCSTHHKPYQGFCQKDKQLLCVTCILEDKHRNHKISSIQQTVAQDKQILTASSEKIKSSISELRNTNSKIRQSIQNSGVIFGSINREIQSFYNKIRLMLKNKEQQSKGKIQAIYNNYLSKLQMSQKEVNEKIQFLIELYKMYQDISILKDIDYLNQANKRIFIVQNARAKTTKVDLQPPLAVFNKGDDIRKIQIYMQELLETEPKKPQGRLKKLMSTTQRNDHIKSDKKDGVLVLQLDLNDKYRKHQETKNKLLKNYEQKDKYNFSSEEEHNLSQIKMRSSQSSVLNRSVQQIFKKDITLSIKDCQFSVREYTEKIYHLGGMNITKTQVLDCNSLEKFNVGFMLQRTKFQAIPLSQFQILILGGSKINNTIVFDIDKLSSSAIDFKLTPPRIGFVAISSNQKLFIIGGNDTKNSLGLVQQYDLRNLTNKPKKLPNLIFPRMDFSGVMGFDGRIYVAGGIGAKNSTLLSCERFDFSRNKWQLIGNMSTARSHFGLVSLPDGVYAVGGSDGCNALSSVQRFDFVQQRWRMVCSMKMSRINHSVCVSGDNQCILVFGGHNSAMLKCIQSYCMVSERWECMGNMLQERYLHQSVVMRSMI